MFSSSSWSYGHGCDKGCCTTLSVLGYFVLQDIDFYPENRANFKNDGPPMPDGRVQLAATKLHGVMNPEALVETVSAWLHVDFDSCVWY
jgi:hypothetical protein